MQLYYSTFLRSSGVQSCERQEMAKGPYYIAKRVGSQMGKGSSVLNWEWEGSPWRRWLFRARCNLSALLVSWIICGGREPDRGKVETSSNWCLQRNGSAGASGGGSDGEGRGGLGGWDVVTFSSLRTGALSVIPLGVPRTWLSPPARACLRDPIMEPNRVWDLTSFIAHAAAVKGGTKAQNLVLNSWY